MAEQDIRMLSIVGSAFGGARELFGGLVKERGEVFKQELQLSGGFDSAGLRRLRFAMGG